jgi:predicted SAM-dependent methyltransferase
MCSAHDRTFPASVLPSAQESRKIIDFKRLVSKYFVGTGPYKLELGAGTASKPGWISTDLCESPDANIFGLDVTRPFPFADDAFHYIYSEHMLEHIPLTSARFMLKECNRTLKTGGVLRLVTPSLGFLLRVMSPDRGLLEREYIHWAVGTFVPDAPTVTNAVFFNNFVRNWGHTFIYDRDTLVFILQEAGFTALKECRINESEHNALVDLENTQRLPEGFLELESMIIEGTK